MILGFDGGPDVSPSQATDEPQHHDVFVELSRRFHVRRTGLRTESTRADLASHGMATIRDADENTRRGRRGRTPPGSLDPTDPKLRATTEMILAMPVDDRLRQLEAESNFFSSIRPVDD